MSRELRPTKVIYIDNERIVFEDEKGWFYLGINDTIGRSIRKNSIEFKCFPLELKVNEEPI